MKGINGKIISDDLDMANEINSYFSSVFTKETTLNIPNFTAKFLEENNQPLSFLDVNEHLVLAKLQSLKVNKSAGPDGIHPCKTII